MAAPPFMERADTIVHKRAREDPPGAASGVDAPPAKRFCRADSSGRVPVWMIRQQEKKAARDAKKAKSAAFGAARAAERALENPHGITIPGNDMPFVQNAFIVPGEWETLRHMDDFSGLVRLPGSSSCGVCTIPTPWSCVYMIIEERRVCTNAGTNEAPLWRPADPSRDPFPITAPLSPPVRFCVATMLPCLHPDLVFIEAAKLMPARDANDNLCKKLVAKIGRAKRTSLHLVVVVPGVFDLILGPVAHTEATMHGFLCTIPLRYYPRNLKKDTIFTAPVLARKILQMDDDTPPDDAPADELIRDWLKYLQRADVLIDAVTPKHWNKRHPASPCGRSIAVIDARGRSTRNVTALRHIDAEVVAWSITDNVDQRVPCRMNALSELLVGALRTAVSSVVFGDVLSSPLFRLNNKTVRRVRNALGAEAPVFGPRAPSTYLLTASVWDLAFMYLFLFAPAAIPPVRAAAAALEINTLTHMFDRAMALVSRKGLMGPDYRVYTWWTLLFDPDLARTLGGVSSFFKHPPPLVAPALYATNTAHERWRVRASLVDPDIHMVAIKVAEEERERTRAQRVAATQCAHREAMALITADVAAKKRREPSAREWKKFATKWAKQKSMAASVAVPATHARKREEGLHSLLLPCPIECFGETMALAAAIASALSRAGGNARATRALLCAFTAIRGDVITNTDLPPLVMESEPGAPHCARARAPPRYKLAAWGAFTNIPLGGGIVGVPVPIARVSVTLTPQDAIFHAGMSGGVKDAVSMMDVEAFFQSSGVWARRLMAFIVAGIDSAGIPATDASKIRRALGLLYDMHRIDLISIPAKAMVHFASIERFGPSVDGVEGHDVLVVESKTAQELAAINSFIHDRCPPLSELTRGEAFEQGRPDAAPVGGGPVCKRDARIEAAIFNNPRAKPNEDQRAFLHAAMRGTGIKVVTGLGGCGKTWTVLQLLRYKKVYNPDARALAVVIPHAVRRLLADVWPGVETMTLASLICSRREDVYDNTFTTLILEEASMIPIGMIAALFMAMDNTRPSGRGRRLLPAVDEVIIIGDPNQTGSVEPGNWLASMREKMLADKLLSPRSVELTIMVRAKHEALGAFNRDLVHDTAGVCENLGLVRPGPSGSTISERYGHSVLMHTYGLMARVHAVEKLKCIIARHGSFLMLIGFRGTVRLASQRKNDSTDWIEVPTINDAGVALVRETEARRSRNARVAEMIDDRVHPGTPIIAKGDDGRRRKAEAADDPIAHLYCNNAVSFVLGYLVKGVLAFLPPLEDRQGRGKGHQEKHPARCRVIALPLTRSTIRYFEDNESTFTKIPTWTTLRKHIRIEGTGKETRVFLGPLECLVADWFPALFSVGFGCTIHAAQGRGRKCVACVYNKRSPFLTLPVIVTGSGRAEEQLVFATFATTPKDLISPFIHAPVRRTHALAAFGMRVPWRTGKPVHERAPIVSAPFAENAEVALQKRDMVRAAMDIDAQTDWSAVFDAADVFTKTAVGDESKHETKDEMNIAGTPAPANAGGPTPMELDATFDDVDWSAAVMLADEAVSVATGSTNVPPVRARSSPLHESANAYTDGFDDAAWDAIATDVFQDPDIAAAMFTGK